MTSNLERGRKRAKRLGFTLIELLIVIAILGVLAAVIVPNLVSFARPAPPSYTERAVYTIYVEEAGERRQIGTLDIGVIQIWLPAEMTVGESRVVSLRLIPSEELRVRPPSVERPETYYEITDTVRIYPVMSAQLKAPTFTVSDAMHSLRIVPADRATEWVWNISAKETGHQLLVMELYVPVQVKGLEMLVTEAVYQKSLEVMVSQPFDWTPVWLALGGSGALIGGIAAIWAVLRRRSHGRNNL